MMAKLVFLREGFGNDRIASEREIPIGVLLKGIGHRKAEYRADELPAIYTDKPSLTGIREPAYVVVHIKSVDVQGMFSRPGYYLLRDVKPEETIRWQEPSA
jgi:hypothetical protein